MCLRFVWDISFLEPTSLDVADAHLLLLVIIVLLLPDQTGVVLRNVSSVVETVVQVKSLDSSLERSLDAARSVKPVPDLEIGRWR